jgi:hypothetical protein
LLNNSCSKILKNKNPLLSAEGLAACQDVSDFTLSAALIFIYDLYQKGSVSGFKL